MNENMKKLIFIVNPISGTQSKELILNLLDEKILGMWCIQKEPVMP